MTRPLSPRCCGLLAVATLLLPCPWSSSADPPAGGREGIEFFERKIRPVLVEHCYECHSAKARQLEAHLHLDSRVGLLRGGDSGQAVVPSRPEESLILSALRYEGLEMPPAGRLPDETVAAFETWIRMGAPDPREESDSDDASPPARIDWEAAKRFWAFQPPQRHTPPPTVHDDWIETPIDAFVLARLEATGLTPNPQADRATLIRRLTFDLTGLPPTPDEVQRFVHDRSANAYERLVDRLLQSPHYGERLAQLWLDVARYAEDQAHIVGNDTSLFYPNAYLYRDWVIYALNSDMAYDRFIVLQLAADLADSPEANDLAALGFLGLGPKYYSRRSLAVMADEWEDRVDTVARGLLGLTVACARCHDHKYDPIPTKDYYALAGVFASTQMFNQPLREDCETTDDGQAKKPEDALHRVRDHEPRDLCVFVRGNVENQGEVVPRRFLRILCDEPPQPFQRGSGRWELAQAIASRSNPLTARVIVNRIWGALFGQPLVETPSNFGNLGQRPTHPELLDCLAVRFMDAGWSLKWLQRQIVLSATYQQSSQWDAAKAAIDPDNQLLWRMSRRRLPVEMWRDAILLAVGRLDGRLGGPSIDPQDPVQCRRTVYSRISRLELNRMLALFDHPDPNAHSARRSQTTTPLQKLFVLNSPFMVGQADALTRRLEREAGTDPRECIEQAYPLLYGRRPRESELLLGLDFLGSPAGAGSPSGDAQRAERWFEYAQVLLSANEFYYLD